MSWYGRHEGVIEVLGLFVRADRDKARWLSVNEVVLNLKNGEGMLKSGSLHRRIHHLGQEGLLRHRDQDKPPDKPGIPGYQFCITAAGKREYERLMALFLGEGEWRKVRTQVLTK